MTLNRRKFTLLPLLASLLIGAIACQPAPAPEATQAATAVPATAAQTAAAPTATTGAEPTATQAAPAGETKNITDQLSRAVEVPANPQRIISLTPTNTEILIALGLGDKIVGVDSYSNAISGAEALPLVGDFAGADVEKTLALTPDLIFAGGKLQQESIGKLEELKLPVVSTEDGDYEMVYKNIQLIADACGVDAQPVIDGMRAKEKAVTDTVSGETRPKVYYAVSYGSMGDYSVGNGSFITDLIMLAGGDCVTKDQSVPWPQTSPEQILAYQPDIVLIGGPEDMVADFSKTEAYKDLPAIKNARVYAINADLVSRGSVGIVDALAEIAKAIQGS